MNRQLSININQLAKNYANGSICPRQVIESALQDAAKLKNLNAFITVTDQLALEQANESAKRFAAGKPRSLLEGVPIAIKDNFCTKGIRTTCASNMLKDFIAPYNATVAERLLEAGAVLIGKTNLDEFAMGSGTVDSIYGPTRNVWSEDLSEQNFRIAGGSSGGSATAVAAGICWAAIGSDTGGSTRNPASYCGIVGLKPTYGLVSRHGLIPLVNSMDVPGIFARSVKDCAIVLNAIAGPCQHDSTNIKKPHLPIDLVPPEELNLRNIRVGIPLEYHPFELSTEVLDTWDMVADLLEDGGANVQQMSLPHTADSIIVYAILNQCEVASNMARYDGVQFGHRAEEERSTEQLYAKTREEGFNSVVKGRILAGNYFLLRQNYDKYFTKALRVRRLIANDFRKAFEKYDVLLTPTTLAAAPQYQQFVANSNPEQCAMQDFCTQSANMAGIPAVSIPVRLSKQGLPLGLQLLSCSLSEEALLTLAQWIEAKVGFNSLEHRIQTAARQ